jgi:putative transposase
MIYHVLNRGNAHATLFYGESDYNAFERVLAEAHSRLPMRILAYTVMPNHWHFLLWPEGDGDLSEFMRWLTVTHAQRCHAHRKTAGSGHVYQGRFKSFPVESEVYFLMVCRYVERNPLRAGLVKRAEDWKWSSLWRYLHGDQSQKLVLSSWPVDRPANYAEYVNLPQTESEVEAIRRCIARGQPYGSERWAQETAKRLGIEWTLRPRGRPRMP